MSFITCFRKKVITIATKSVKTMLLPNNKQQSRLFDLSNARRFAYNWALAKEMENLEQNKLFIPEQELRKEFTKLKHTQGYEWLNEVDNDVTKQAIRDVVASYKRYFKLRKEKGYKPYSKQFLQHMKQISKQPTVYQSRGHPKFKKKRNMIEYGFYQDVYKIQFTETHVRLTLVAGKGKAGTHRAKKLCHVKLAETGRVPVNTKLLNPRVTFDGLHWWISVAYEFEPETQNINNNRGLGIDLGVKDLAICSDDVIYENINRSKGIQQLEKRKRRLQRSVSRKYRQNKKGESYCRTCNIIKAEKELLKLEQRLTNVRNNHVYQSVSDIMKREPSFICLEDLNISGMMKNRHLSKAIQNQKLYLFRQVITCKADWLLVPVVTADRFYPSSKRCSCCGNIKKDLKLSDRIYKCETCGFICDRDKNASYNLEQYGKQQLTGVIQVA